MMPPALRVSGTRLITETGAPAKYVEVDYFSLLARWLMHDGPAALVGPKLDEIRAVAHEGGYDGPIGLRAFRHAAPPNAFAVNPQTTPGYYPSLRACSEFCGERGFYVDWTGGDAQIVFPTDDPRQADRAAFTAHVNESCAAVVDLPNVLWQTINEDFKNGNVGDTPVPVWGTIHPMIRCSGRFGGGDPNAPGWIDAFQPILDVQNFHGTREDGGYYWPKWLWDLPATAAVLKQGTKRPVFFDEEMGADEVNQAEARSNDPSFFYVFGTLLAWVDGITMHSTDGIIGNAYRPLTRACHVAFFRGAAEIVRDLR